MTQQSLLLDFPSDKVTAERRSQKLIDEYLAIEAHDARKAGAIGYLPSILIQAALPYRDPGNEQPVWKRQGGNLTLYIRQGHQPVARKSDDGAVLLDSSGQPLMDHIPRGYPYGSIPRILMAWMVSEAVKLDSPTLVLGQNLTGFMHSIGLDTVSGGPNGTINRMRDQAKRLFSSSIQFVRVKTVDGEPDEFMNLDLFKSASIRDKVVGSSVTLSEDFFSQIQTHKGKVPLDMRAISALKQSPLALDIYAWLTWRFSYLDRNLELPWDVLHRQFGSTSTALKKFRETFRHALAQVLIVYPQARVDASQASVFKMFPSATHVPKRLATPTGR